MAELLEIVEDYDGPWRDLIRTTPVSVISEIELTDLPPQLPWSAGHACLIGDAAHPTTPDPGQGGGRAVEDAWTLSRCLAEYREPSQAFHAFEAARFKKVKTIVDSSWRLGAFVYSGWPRLRNFLFRLAPEKLTMRVMERLYRVDSLV